MDRADRVRASHMAWHRSMWQWQRHRLRALTQGFSSPQMSKGGWVTKHICIQPRGRRGWRSVGHPQERIHLSCAVQEMHGHSGDLISASALFSPERKTLVKPRHMTFGIQKSRHSLVHQCLVAQLCLDVPVLLGAAPLLLGSEQLCERGSRSCSSHLDMFFCATDAGVPSR